MNYSDTKETFYNVGPVKPAAFLRASRSKVSIWSLKEYTLSNGQLDTTTLWKRNPRLVSLTDDEYVSFSSSKRMICSIFNVNDIISTIMSLTMGDNTHSSNIVSSGNHSNVANIKFNVSGNFIRLEIESDSITDLDSRIRITNRTSIMSDKIRYTALPKLYALDFPKFIFSFFGGDAMDCESSLDIVYETEVLGCFVDGDDVLEAGWVV